MACQSGQEKIVEMLKEAGSNLEVKTEVSCRWRKQRWTERFLWELHLVAFLPIVLSTDAVMELVLFWSKVVILSFFCF